MQSGGGVALIAVAVVVTCWLVWYALVGIRYATRAVCLAFVEMGGIIWRTVRPPLVRALGWVASARHDMSKDDATGDNPTVLTVKLVALVAGLFAGIVIALRLYKWAARMIAEPA